MNERIKELSEQAGFQINPLKGLIHLPGLNPTANIQLEKFAELIVKECIAQLEYEQSMLSVSEWDNQEYADRIHAKLDGLNDGIGAIKYHFGVAE